MATAVSRTLNPGEAVTLAPPTLLSNAAALGTFWVTPRSKRDVHARAPPLDALKRQRRWGAEAGVHVRFVYGDVTDLNAAAVGSGFRLFLDTGPFHGLTNVQRVAMGRTLTAIATPGATRLCIVGRDVVAASGCWEGAYVGRRATLAVLAVGAAQS